MDSLHADGRTHEPGIQIIPGVEACHSGPVPLAAIVGMLLVDRHDRNLNLKLGKPDESTGPKIAEFKATLPPHEDDPVVWRYNKADGGL